MKLLEFIKQNRNQIQEIIDCIKVGIFLADSSGNVVILNDESAKTGNIPHSELIGMNVRELVKMRYMEESATLKVLASLKDESILQDLSSGETLFIVGHPYINNNLPEFVVCTERDVTEVTALRELLDKKEKIAIKYKEQLDYFKERQFEGKNHIVCQSNSLKETIALALKTAERNTTVLISGESGTGKEVIATLIHQNSHRSKKPFIKINCAAIPENLLESELFGYAKGAFTGAEKGGKAGMFELADTGTLFLDEVSEMSIQMQAKLLRVLQEGEITRVGGSNTVKIDVRIITATNVNLEEAILNGRFRADLFYRLNVMPIKLPPLRERHEDISELAKHFVTELNKEYNLNKILLPDAVEVLNTYSWPGNVRELRNIIERLMIISCGNEINKTQVEKQLFIKEHDSPDSADNASIGSLSERMENFEKNLLVNLLQQCKTRTEMAEQLKVDRSTISRKLKKYNILDKEQQ